ncbi:MAG: hypothetical protein AAF892_17750 [Cyanobacteria bacterium P01_D01_bin.71]
MTVSFQTFRDRHPTARLTSELLLSQGDRFVVRVLIETDSGGCASGLAAHNSIEMAEDQARRRALEGLGWSFDDLSNGTAAPPEKLPIADTSTDFVSSELSPTPAGVTHTAPAAAVKAHIDTPVPAAAPARPGRQTKVQPPVPTKPAPQVAKSGAAGEASPVAASVTVSSPLSQGEPELSPAPPTATGAADLSPEPEAAIAPIAPAALPAPINLSDVIAQTDIELRRLGWSVETGREYLEHTYQKRSRHELSEEELIQFLCHLESL